MPNHRLLSVEQAKSDLKHLLADPEFKLLDEDDNALLFDHQGILQIMFSVHCRDDQPYLDVITGKVTEGPLVAVLINVNRKTDEGHQIGTAPIGFVPRVNDLVEIVNLLGQHVGFSPRDKF